MLNRLEVSSHADWPTHVRHEGETYRRRAEATPHENLDAVWSGHAAAAGIPLGCGRGAVAVSPGRSMGLRHGCTPALAERVGFHAGQAGATRTHPSGSVETRSRSDDGRWPITPVALEPVRRHSFPCGGKRRPGGSGTCSNGPLPGRERGQPTLAVGRDGITVGNQPHGFFEVATCATVSVHDRRGRPAGNRVAGLRSGTRPADDDRGTAGSAAGDPAAVDRPAPATGVYQRCGRSGRSVSTPNACAACDTR